LNKDGKAVDVIFTNSIVGKGVTKYSLSILGADKSDYYIDTKLASMTINWKDVCDSVHLNASKVNRCFISDYKMISPFFGGSFTFVQWSPKLKKAFIFNKDGTFNNLLDRVKDVYGNTLRQKAVSRIYDYDFDIHNISDNISDDGSYIAHFGHTLYLISGDHQILNSFDYDTGTLSIFFMPNSQNAVSFFVRRYLTSFQAFDKNLKKLPSAYIGAIGDINIGVNGFFYTTASFWGSNIFVDFDTFVKLIICAI